MQKCHTLSIYNPTTCHSSFDAYDINCRGITLAANIFIFDPETSRLTFYLRCNYIAQSLLT